MIKVIELIIDESVFKKYLSIFGVTLTEIPHPFIDRIPTGEDVEKQVKEIKKIYLTQEEKISQLNDVFATARGHLVELILFCYFSNKGYDVRWRFKEKKIGEIDVLAKDKHGTLYVSSCMSEYHGYKIPKLIKKVKRTKKHRQKLPKGFREFQDVKSIVFSFHELSSRTRNELRQKGIIPYSFNELSKDPVFSRFKKKELRKIFENKFDVF